MNNKIKWVISLLKSITNNQQLEFTNQIYISYVFQDKPFLQMIKYRFIRDGEIICFFDKRSKTFKQLSKYIQILWHFPLSKEKYIISCIQEEVQDHNLKEEFWQLVDKEERKSYHSIPPDQFVEEKQQSDLEKFNPLDKDELSFNFAVIKFVPYQVEHTKDVMPQVIADSRTSFESIFKPYKKVSKVLHTIEKNEWISRQLS
ncbi:hypothetical protein pb186bvf_015025 [Paramecium bursaria]